MTSEPVGSLWAATCREQVPLRALGSDLEADLAIIGGGFTGCAAALEAARLGARVVLLEAQTIGHGASGRNAGLVNAGLWLPPDAVVAALGEAPGTRLMAALAQGPERVFELIGRHRIDCEPLRRGTLHLAHAPAGVEELRRRLAQGNRLGAPLRLLDGAETARRTGSAAFAGALFDPRAGTIQPLAYCRGLARAAAEAGAAVFQHAPVARVAQEGGRWILSAAGHTVRAGAVLVATDAYHSGVAGIPAPRFVPVRYCQFATAPLPAPLRTEILPGGEGCWDTARVMTSVRMDGAGRLILGGIGDGEGPGAPIHRAWARRKLRALYPALARHPFERVWSGTIGMTSDHIPKVAEVGPRGLAVFGYSGRGIGPGTVFGAAAARALVGGDREALPVTPVARHRETLTGVRAAFHELGAVAMHALPARRSGPGS